MWIAFARKPVRAGGRRDLTAITDATFNGSAVVAQARTICLAFVAVTMAGCYGIPTSSEPSRLTTAEDVLPPPNRADGTPTFSARSFTSYQNAVARSRDVARSPDAQYWRNEFITETMAAIDVAYTEYERQLTNQVDESGFWAKVLTLGLSGAVPLVPAGTTKDALAAGSTFIGGSDAAFSEKILVSKTIQNVQTQMRKDRHDQKAVILANMQCNVVQYPMGLALADLETYRRYGTFASGIIGVTNTVNTQEAVAKSNEKSQNPGQGGGTDNIIAGAKGGKANGVAVVQIRPNGHSARIANAASAPNQQVTTCLGT